MLIDPLLRQPLEQVARRQRRLLFWCKLAVWWLLAAVLAFAVVAIQRQSGWASSLSLPLAACAGLCTALLITRRASLARTNWRRLAAQIESLHPTLEGRLLTAVQQQPQDGTELNFLQQRLVREAIWHSEQHDWSAVIPQSRIAIAQVGHWLALALFVCVLLGLRTPGSGHGPLLVKRLDSGSGVTVTPGDTTLERGSSLVVLTRFNGALPATVDLAVEDAAGAKRHIPLVKSLSDPMFGGSVPEVSSNFTYHVEYGGLRTRDFKVSVFEYPRLERADADVTYPAYTSLPTRRVGNTRRLSAVEGSHLDLTLKLNKPVTTAKLVPRDKARETIALRLTNNRAGASLEKFPLDANQTFDLQLVDADGRTNKVPAQFVFEALKNRPPELKLASPRGDVRPSPLEEISFEGTVWDDFGVPAYGLGYSCVGQETKFIELGRNVPGKEKRAFKHLLALEDLGVAPDQFISWFVWADDIGPDGQTRRTFGDLFFGEIRPFEEVFREGQGMDGQGEQSGEQSGQQQDSPTTKLAELQKQIISATWRLQREHPGTNRAAGKRAVGTQKSETRLQTTPRNNALSAALPSPMHSAAGAKFMAQPAPSSQPSRPSGARGRPARPRTDPNLSKAQNYEDDAVVVRDSQAQALEQAESSVEQSQDPRTGALWTAAAKEMEKALARLKQATNSPAVLPDALAAEQAAYQALLKLQEHEYQVSRSRRQNRNQSGNSRNQQMQRQLEQMDLTQSENRYETQRQAQRPQTPQNREQLQVMNRLQELARRQQDLNDRLKELQTALQEARTEQERADIQRRLKRLQEEEQQMLSDVDELRQRMDRPENQSRMADERQQLDQTREDVQRAADAASQGAASQALASGTRAQRQLQDMRDQMRKENSNQFADDLREMRSQARELAQQQEDIQKKIQDELNAEHRSLDDSADKKSMLDQVARQKELITNLVERATQVSQQAEDAEPLLSRQLYDSVRKYSQTTGKDVKELQDQLLSRGLMTRSLFDQLKDSPDPDGAKIQDITAEMLRLGILPQANDTGQRARAGLDDLKRGVERAAESVLGDDTEALRLAKDELKELTDQLDQEIAQAENGSGSRTNQTRPGAQAGARNQRSSTDSQDRGANGGERGQNQNQSGDQTAQNQDQSQNQEQGAGGDRSRESASNRAGRNNSSARQQNGQPNGGQPGSETSPTDPQQQQSGEQAASNQGGRGGGRQGQVADAARPGQDARDNSQTGERIGGDRAGGDRNAVDRLDSGSLRRGGAWTGGGGWNNIWDGGYDYGPFTGRDFISWSDRLRDVEEMIEVPQLRNDVATARERARLLRQQYKKDLTKPDWAVVRLQVMKPLLEVRDRIADELARRDSREALVPIDRDPVPNRYSDLVRHYYEELGKEK